MSEFINEAEERRRAARSAEITLLSAAMQWSDVADNVLSALQPGHLGDPRHGLILEALGRVRNAGILPSGPSVEGELEARGNLAKVGPEYLYEVYEAAAAADHAEEHLRMVRGFARLRRLARDAGHVARNASEANWTEAHVLGEAFERVVANYTAETAERAPLIFLPNRAQEFAEKRAPELVGLREAQPPGLITGLATLDKAMVWRPGQLYTLTAATGGGKTTLAWFLACQAARLSGRASLYFSIEMPGDFLTIRHLSAASKVPTTYLERGPLSRQEVLEIKGASAHAPPVFISEEGAGTSISVVPRGLRQVIRDGFRPGLVVIDLLARYELPEGERSRGQRQEDVTRLVRFAAGVAAKYEVPVLNLVQVNRLGVLRESDAPAHDSDVVMQLTANKAERLSTIVFKKVRFGMPAWEGDALELGFDPTTGAFWDLPSGGISHPADPAPKPGAFKQACGGWGGAKPQPAGEDD